MHEILVLRACLRDLSASADASDLDAYEANEVRELADDGDKALTTLEALVGKALRTRSELCAEALREHGAYLTAAAPSSDADVAERARGEAMLALAKELAR